MSTHATKTILDSLYYFILFNLRWVSVLVSCCTFDVWSYHMWLSLFKNIPLCSYTFNADMWQQCICLCCILLWVNRPGRQTGRTGVQSHDPALTWMKEMVTLLETKQGKGESEGLAGQPLTMGPCSKTMGHTKARESTPSPPSHSHIAIEPVFHTGLWTAIQSNYCLTRPLTYTEIKMSLAGCI